jgi:NAD(P)-dependent dehydrogenase (short-subunit alcohol dehydrogenase family)
MKVVVIGGTGMLGSKVVDKLRDHGDEAVAASPNTGVNTLTGEGLAETLAGADVVVDVSNSPSFEDGPVMEFFTQSTTNLEAAAKAAGIRSKVMDADRDSNAPRPKISAHVASCVIRVRELDPWLPESISAPTCRNSSAPACLTVRPDQVAPTGSILPPMAAAW